MKASAHMLTVVASFVAGAVLVSVVAHEWTWMTAQSVGGMRGGDSSVYGGAPQTDPSGSANREPDAVNSLSSQSVPTDDTVPPWVRESASSVDSTGEEDGEWSDWDPTFDDPPPDPYPTKIPPPPPIQEIQPSATDGNWPNGINGLNTINGINGLNTINGINGLNGLNGINSINGLNGSNGINGTNAVRSTTTTQVGGVSGGKRKPWWKDLWRGPAPLETVIPEAWQKVPGGGAEAESADFDEEEEPWSSFMDATEPSDDEEGVEEDNGDEERGGGIVSPSAPVGSETVLSWVRDAIEEVGGAINAFFSSLFSY